MDCFRHFEAPAHSTQDRLPTVLQLGYMTDLYSEFQAASRLVAKILGVADTNTKSEKYETPKVGVDYVSDVFAKNVRFNFHLRTESRGSSFDKWISLS